MATTKKKPQQIILAAVEPVGRNKNQETIYELRAWKSDQIHARGNLHKVLDAAERLWRGHVRVQNGGPDKYMILEAGR